MFPGCPFNQEPGWCECAFAWPKRFGLLRRWGITSHRVLSSVGWGVFQRYCWWTKSCTTKDDDYLIIYQVLTIPGGAGFCPSTVLLKHETGLETCFSTIRILGIMLKRGYCSYLIFRSRSFDHLGGSWFCMIRTHHGKRRLFWGCLELAVGLF